MSFASLPVINLKSNPDDIRQTLLLASTTTGFFYVSNHELNSLQNQMFSMAKEFFYLPLYEKLLYVSNPTSYDGYIRIGRENLDSTNLKLIDEKEAFKMRESALNRKDKLPNIFSHEENFKIIEQFFRQCYDLCMHLFQYLAETFQIDKDYFTSRHKWNQKPGVAIKLLHYPPINQIEQNTNVIRAGAHSDYGSLTLLFQHDNKSGLEVFDRLKNCWYPVEARNDMIVVNFGDVFEYWTKGMIKSTIHRVILPNNINEQNQSRFSIAFFCVPNGDTLLTPIPSKLIENYIYTKDEHAKHVFNDNDGHVLTAGEHLQMRL
ncbi:unnamed protein product, partial [Rotaria sordida]